MSCVIGMTIRVEESTVALTNFFPSTQKALDAPAPVVGSTPLGMLVSMLGLGAVGLGRRRSLKAARA